MMYTKVLLLVLAVRTYGHQKMCEGGNNMDITKGTHLSNGDVYFEGIKYEKSEYVMDSETGSERVCVCEKQTCVRKCCPYGRAYDFVQKVCVVTSEAFDPPVWNNWKVLRNVNASERFHFLFGKMNCTLPEYRVRVGQVTKVHRLTEDGQLYVELPHQIPPWSLFPPDKYCIDTFVSGEGPDMVTSLDALICFPSETKEENNTYTMSSTCMLISCVFILATVAIYAWLPELRNLHGRVLMAYLMCLFVGFLFMSTMQILLRINNINEHTCLVLTFIIYFTLLSAFFWLNVMCFDIWWTFSGKRGISEKMSVNARFGAYAAYAFSVPSALTVILAVLEFSDLPPNPFMPRIKYQGCFLYGTSKLLYFYGPIVVLCVANMVFFLLTAIKINSIKKQTSVLKSKESAMHDQHRNDKQRLTLYVKLFVVMGISWLLEVISAIYPQADSFWRYTDAYNVLIGVTIFVIFVCKRKIFRLIKKRYRQVRGVSNVSRTQTVTSRTISCRDEIRMGSVKTSI